MADIELIIKIPEEMYKWVYDVNKFSNDYGMGDFIDLIKNGTPLPKGHGRLIDTDDLKWQFDKRDELNGYIENIIAVTPTIIEADKVESEDKE